MSSPAKKRKLNNGSKTTAASSKGLEYFFSKQKQKSQSHSVSSPSVKDGPTEASAELTDEELARKLQDEWNQEVATERSNGDKSRTPDTTSQNDEKGTPDTEPPIEAKLSSTLMPKLTQVNGTKTLTLQSVGISEDSLISTIPLDESPLTFDPSKYVCKLQQHWESESGDSTYSLLTRCFVLVSATASRIKIVDTLVNCLRLLIEGDPSSLLPAVGHLPYCLVS